MTSRHRRCHHALLLLGWLLLSSHVIAEPRPKIVFSCWIPETVPLHQRVNTLFSESFDALGYDFGMHYRPNQRSLMEANAGISDGDCARTLDYRDNNPESSLIRIDVLLARTSMEAWSRNPELTLNTEQDLTRESLRIGYVRGHVVIKELMQRHELPNVISVTSTEHGLKMVSAGRLDLFIGTSVSTRQEMQQIELTQPIYSAGHVLEIEGYAYLNEAHRALLPSLERELRERLPTDGWQFE
ncbi:MULTISPECIES: hypothetical protein [unclassified Marinimicrobium]|uniref:hypothetical protein n=1 Tax=unclassified Marinimicrobium TaxID=2632100 RepID=UPI000C436B9D|nr:MULTISPECIES: hypothetical protein [unclassified Marinimicrobium]MAN51720.1 hypothetical protein [Marinimicrobium sp.]